ncbi:2TM domain-containing protein [Robiginitalea sp. IMCC43444]|uniref:2TM domain-containing protein n=1 Tax=Robiginitalea sp. IMCC43444 TaxID=3459121 RepID=UPI004041447F
MLSKNKKGTTLDLEQHEQVEYAQRRIRQKKNLYRHFVFFLIGSVFIVFLNKILKYGETYDWYLWVILVWSFFLLVHLVQVFIMDPFMGQQWERRQREQLLQKQQERIRALQKEVEASHPLPEPPKKKDL